MRLKKLFFLLNKDSAPGPDGFGGGFYHAFWDIISLDVFFFFLDKPNCIKESTRGALNPLHSISIYLQAKRPPHKHHRLHL